MRSLVEYNKALRNLKRYSFRKKCEEVEEIQVCARLYMIRSKGTQVSINNNRNKYNRVHKNMRRN